MEISPPMFTRACTLLLFTIIASACSSFDCTPHKCQDLAPGSASTETVNICDRGDGYVRLDGEDGEEIYECYCDAAFMKDVAARHCATGAVCGKGGAACATSGDCCAGRPCTFNICG
jgi:hypothetical protein